MQKIQDTSITSMDFLHTQDNRLVTREEKQIKLRGTNLGGWLIQEAWMCPLDKGDKGWANWDTLEAFHKRGFTQQQILAMFQVYEDNWITSLDLDHIKNMGMNCVRVPFWYRNFQMDDSGAYYSEGNMDENPGFQRLDWVIRECGERGMYVILDLHGAPGFQSDDHCCGKSGRGILFDNSKEGESARALTIELWQRIATRYVNNPVVAAYDLLNEPMNSFEGKRKNDQVLWDFYDELIRAIRKIDAEHIISVEGIWEISNLPDPKQFGWNNVLYQTHNYNWKTREVDQKIQDVKDRVHWKVPIYVGEFQSHEIWDYTLEAYNKEAISWTTWSYKGVKSDLPGWFAYRNLNSLLVDPETDSYEDILEKWSRTRTEDGFVRDEMLAEILSKYAGQGDNP